MWKKCRVIPLRTKDKTNIVDFHSGFGFYGQPYPNIQLKEDEEYIHLYIISDDEIRVGDWCYNETDPILKGDIYQAEDSVDLEFLTGKDESSPIKGTTKKIIGSTDLSINVARLPDEFVREYCRLGGIDNVMVEYTECSAKPYEPCMKCLGDITCNNCRYQITWKPNINSDNTINIKKIKDSWSKEEFPIQAIKDILKYCEDQAIYDKMGKYNDPYYKLNQWIRENL